MDEDDLMYYNADEAELADELSKMISDDNCAGLHYMCSELSYKKLNIVSDICYHYTCEKHRDWPPPKRPLDELYAENEMITRMLSKVFVEYIAASDRCLDHNQPKKGE